MAAETVILADEMMQRDRASRLLGMTVIERSAGRAVVRMTVTPDMTNGFSITHGGFVFALADTAFAIACNSGENLTVAAGADITFLKPTRAGDELTATAGLRASSGRSGLYDVEIVDGGGDIVAEFRGRSRTTPQTLASLDATTTTEVER